MATQTKFECYSENLAEKVHNLDTDVIKVMLTNTAPNAATHTVKTDITEISAGNGYTAGGVDCQWATSRSGGTTSVTGTDVVITASGGSIGPFRYAVFYNATAGTTPLISYVDYGSSITLADGESLTVDFGSTVQTIA